MIEFKLNKYKFHSVSVVSQFGFWRQREVVGANVEQSYISLKLKPKVTLFKASMAQGVFQSMAIFPWFRMFFELILNVERDQDPFEFIRLQTIGCRIMWIVIKGHNAFSIQNHSLSYLTQNGVNLHMYVCM